MFGLKRSIAVVLMAGVTAFAANPGDPVAIIKKKDAELQKMLRDKGASKDRLKVLINGIFDFEELGKRALGPETWKTMTPDQQKRFVKAFREMVENASVRKLEAYESDSSTYEAPEIANGKASVTAHVWNKGTESVVTYKLLAEDSTWKAWDLIIDDLSTARNYGDQFKTILKTSNIDGLIAKLEKKANEGGDTKSADNLKAKSEKGATAHAKASSAKSSSASAKAPAKGPAAAAPVTP
ncbi:MAG: ABC transporter substrate-binding protein [Fibrobacteres bacterium]|nr:ABC transporter substrate-binding protein [Fibrobacterota bacterium]